MYSRNRLKVVSFRKVRPGSKLYYHYRIESKKPLTLPFSGAHIFREDFPIKKKVISLVVPDTIEISFNIEPDKKFTEEDYRFFQWKRENLPRIKDYNYKPPVSHIAEELIYSSVKSWRKLGSIVYNILYEEIKPIRKMRELEESYYFVRDSVRTIPIPLPFIGLKSISSKEIIEKRYGAPRDKSMLLISLLKGAKYDAFPALICRPYLKEDEIYKIPPNLSHFISIIAGVRIGDSIRFFEPSCNYCGLKYTTFEGETAWIILEDTSYFYEIPKATSNQIQLESHCELSSKGDLRAKINAELSGYFSEHFQNWIKSDNESNKRGYLEYLLSEISISAKSDSMWIDVKGDTVKINLEFESQNYASKQGNYITMKLLSNIIKIFPLSSLIESKERPYPYYLNFSNATLQEKTVLLYPESFELTYLPEEMDLSGDGYRFKIEASSKKGEIKYTRKASYNKIIISEKSNVVEDLRKFMDKNTTWVLFMED